MVRSRDYYELRVRVMIPKRSKNVIYKCDKCKEGELWPLIEAKGWLCNKCGRRLYEYAHNDNLVKKEENNDKMC